MKKKSKKNIGIGTIFTICFAVMAFVADFLGAWSFIFKNEPSPTFQEKLINDTLINTQKTDSTIFFQNLTIKKQVESSKNIKEQVNIKLEDNSKVGNIITGDSNRIEIKQEF